MTEEARVGEDPHPYPWAHRSFEAFIEDHLAASGMLTLCLRALGRVVEEPEPSADRLAFGRQLGQSEEHVRRSVSELHAEALAELDRGFPYLFGPFTVAAWDS